MKAKLLLVLVMCLKAFDSQSFADPCAEGSPFQKLSRHNGKKYLGKCDVEIHVCEKRNSAGALPDYMTHALTENTQFWIGDIFVKHANGQSLYVPIFSPSSKFPRTHVSVVDDKQSLTYRYKDSNYDPVSGLKEKYEVTFYKGRPKIELSMKNSRESRKRPIRSLFFPNVKIICEELTK